MNSTKHGFLWLALKLWLFNFIAQPIAFIGGRFKSPESFRTAQITLQSVCGMQCIQQQHALQSNAFRVPSFITHCLGQGNNLGGKHHIASHYISPLLSYPAGISLRSGPTSFSLASLLSALPPLLVTFRGGMGIFILSHNMKGNGHK